MENYSKQLEYTEKTTTGTTFPSLYKKEREWRSHPTRTLTVLVPRNPHTLMLMSRHLLAMLVLTERLQFQCIIHRYKITCKRTAT